MSIPNALHMTSTVDSGDVIWYLKYKGIEISDESRLRYLVDTLKAGIVSFNVNPDFRVSVCKGYAHNLHDAGHAWDSIVSILNAKERKARGIPSMVKVDRVI